ncbi:MAG: hypothetical protein MdMp014T_3031 [Treponematales bacterium]
MNTSAIRSVRISGKAQVGKILTAAAYDGEDGTGGEVTDAVFTWKRAGRDSGSNPSDYTAISEAAAKTYTPTADDVGKFIGVWAANDASNGAGKYINTFGPVLPEESGITPLTAGSWASGDTGTTDGIEWFQFTATADTQYIHIDISYVTSGMSAYNLLVELSDGNGSEVGSEYDYYGGRKTNSWTVTSGQTYYVRVRPNSSISGSGGTFRIAFSASSTVDGGDGEGETQPRIFTVSFDLNYEGAPDPPEPLTDIHEGGRIRLPYPGATRPGYTFFFWWTQAESGDEAGPPLGYYCPTRSLTLYAHWRENEAGDAARGGAAARSGELDPRPREQAAREYDAEPPDGGV